MSPVQIQHIRNATAKIKYAETTFLVDPMLGKKGAYPGFDGFQGTPHSHLPNPLTELPLPVEDIMKDVDAVIVSHTHLDHWDKAAQDLLPKGIPLFAQDEADAETIRAQGFTNVEVLGKDTVFRGVRLSKTGGLHGTESLGYVMGFVFQAPGSKTIYVAGDTVWVSEVEQTLTKFNPDVIVLNTGDARFDGADGGIIMGKDDTLHALRSAPNATIIAVHMDALNHCGLSRKTLREYVKQNNIQDRVLIPEDGESIQL